MVRSETSTKNKYWIEKHRYYELKHFCRQYKCWHNMLKALDGYSSNSGCVHYIENCKKASKGDPTAKTTELREQFTKKIDMLNKAADETDPVLGNYILIGVTEGMSFEVLNARANLPCGRDYYYDLYRKFFWLLDQARE